MPRKQKSKRSTRVSRSLKWTLASKVPIDPRFLFTFVCRAPDGTHHTVQVIHHNQRDALKLAKEQFLASLEGGYGTYSAYAFGYGYAYAYAYGYAYGYGYGYGYGAYAYGGAYGYRAYAY